MGIYLVMKNNFKRSLHHKILFTVTFLLPVILCLIAGSINFGKTSVRAGILGFDDTSMTESDKEMIYGILDRSEGITYALADENTGNADLMTGKFHVILDYRGSTRADGFHLLSFQKEEKKAMITAMFLMAFNQNEPIRLTGLKPEGLSVTERTIALLLTMFMVLSTIHTSIIIRDKQSGTLLRYQYAKKSGNSYIAGCFIHSFLINYGQVLLCTGVLLLVQKGFSLSGIEVLFLPAVIAAIAAVLSLVICLGSKSEVQANITASAITGLLSILGGTFVAVEAMPGLLRILSYASPIRWVLELLKNYFIRGL